LEEAQEEASLQVKIIVYIRTSLKVGKKLHNQEEAMKRVK